MKTMVHVLRSAGAAVRGAHRRDFAMIALVFLLGGCDYARMNNDEAVDLYQTELPETPVDSIPTKGGLTALRMGDPDQLSNPMESDASAVERGRRAYLSYCIQCHGPNGRGRGTVGQSFAPLPTDLHAQSVQSSSDGQIFARVSLGYRRHPPLYSTVPEPDRWALVLYIRSLKPN